MKSLKASSLLYISIAGIAAIGISSAVATVAPLLRLLPYPS